VEQVEDSKEDTVYYALKKFFNLALNANPNILEILWLRENHYIWKDLPENRKKLGKLLITNRDLFMSKKIRHSMMGYAYQQFHRMDKLNKNEGNNAFRVASVEKYGYDTKNAMHLIRLCKMALEALVEGEIHVWREDAHLLTQIREGYFTYDALAEKFHKYEELVEEAYVNSSLPHKPDRKRAGQLIMEMTEEFLKEC